METKVKQGADNMIQTYTNSSVKVQINKHVHTLGEFADGDGLPTWCVAVSWHWLGVSSNKHLCGV